MRGSYSSVIFSSNNGRPSSQSLTDAFVGKSQLPFFIDPFFGAVIFDDFLSAGAGGNTNWTVAVVGNSVGAGSTSANDAMGVVFNGASGNGTPSRGFHYLATNGIEPDTAKIFFQCRIGVSTLSNGTDPFEVRVGLFDGLGAGDPSNGILWKYDQANNGNFWEIVTRSSGVDTTEVLDGNGGRDTAPVTVAYQTVGFILDSTGVDFYFNKEKIGSKITTNIPTSNVGPAIKLDKTTGTQTRNYLLDYVYLAYLMNSER